MVMDSGTKKMEIEADACPTTRGTSILDRLAAEIPMVMAGQDPTDELEAHPTVQQIRSQPKPSMARYRC